MKRTFVLLLSLVPGLGLAGLAVWLYTQRTEPSVPVAEVTTQPPATVAAANPTPPPPALVKELTPEEEEQLRLEEDRLANLRESLAEVKQDSSPTPEVPNESAANTDEPSALPDAANARVAMLEAEIKSLSTSKSAIEEQLQQLDTQILELQARLPTLSPGPNGAPNPQGAALRSQLDALKATRIQLEEQKTAAAAPPSQFENELGKVAMPKIDFTAQRVSDLRAELEYWQQRKTEGATPTLQAKRTEQLESQIASQEKRIQEMQQRTASRKEDDVDEDGEQTPLPEPTPDDGAVTR